MKQNEGQVTFRVKNCFEETLFDAKSDLSLVFAVMFLFVTVPAFGQGGRGGQRGQPPQTPKAAAPIDLTGYWVSVVTEDWRWRMVTPAKGDFASIPTNPAGVAEGQQWDPAKDEAAGEQCKSYGAPAIMRVPTRLHITWDNDTTLKVETDAGQQTRLFHFGEYQPAPLRPYREIRLQAGKPPEAVVADRPREAI